MEKGLKSLKPVYLIYGEQELLLERALERLKERASHEGDPGFSFELFRGGETNIAEIINSLNTLSFAFGKKVVVIKNADKLKASELSKIKKYAENPTNSTNLILVAGKLKRNSLLLKAIKEKGVASEYKPPKKSEYPLWIKEEFQERNKKISLLACKFMVQHLGFDLKILKHEIEKICTYHEEKDSLDVEDIELLLSEGEAGSVFDLIDAIGERNQAKFFALLEKQPHSQDSYLHLFNLIIRHFRLLFKAKVSLDKGKSLFSLSKEFNLPVYVVEKYQTQSRNFSIEQLKNTFRLLLEAEVSFKTSEKEPELILELLINKILMD